MTTGSWLGVLACVSIKRVYVYKCVSVCVTLNSTQECKCNCNVAAVYNVEKPTYHKNGHHISISQNVVAPQQRNFLKKIK